MKTVAKWSAFTHLLLIIGWCCILRGLWEIAQPIGLVALGALLVAYAAQAAIERNRGSR